MSIDRIDYSGNLWMETRYTNCPRKCRYNIRNGSFLEKCINPSGKGCKYYQKYEKIKGEIDGKY